MIIGPNHPSSGQSAGGQGRGRRGRRNQPKRGPQQNKQNRQQNRQGGIYTAPMDHSYRAALQGNGHQRGGRPRPALGTQYLQPEPEPLPNNDANSAAAPRIFAFVDDLFFLAKITETARKLNVKVEFVKAGDDILDRIGQNGDQKPSLIIVDLNNTSMKPISTISKLKSKLKKQTTVIGFLSHVQGDLKIKALDAGCDMVLPRSSFSQNLPQLLRRHGAPEG
jgi:CheY-like chemotaxis protein